MKIAVIENHEIATYTIRLDLMMAFVQEGFDVNVLTEQDNSFIKDDLKKTIHVVNVGASVLNPVTAVRYMGRLNNALKRIKPDVCLTFTIRPAIYGNIVTRLLKVPTISTITGTGPLFTSNSLSYRLARWLYSWVLKKTRKVFFPNYDDLNAFVKKGYIKNTVAVRVPGSGINYDKFSPQPCTRCGDGKFIFLFVSRLVKDKGILEFVKAASIISTNYPAAEFHVIGPVWSNNKKSLTVTQHELDEWIEKKWIIYHSEQKDIRPFIADADCVVMPSYREGMNNVLLEAASMARPLIATDVTGCRDIVEDNVNGLLCKVKDGKDLAEKMKRMMSLSAEEREAMGRKGREKMIREFDKKIVVQSYLNEVKAIVDGSK